MLLNNAALTLSTVLQLAAATLAVRLVRTSGRRTAWLILAVAMFLQGGLHLFTLVARVTGSMPVEPTNLVAESVRLVFSLMLLGGVAILGSHPRPAAASVPDDARGEHAPVTREELYSFLIDRIPEAFVVLVGGYLVFTNRAFATIFGVDAHAALGRRLSDFFESVAEDRPPANSEDSDSGEYGSTRRLEAEIARPTGERRWVEVRLSRAQWQGQPAELGLIRDISERRQARFALKQERDFISALLETAGALLVVLDADGRIARSNRACEEVTGFSAAEMVGRRPWEFLLAPEAVDTARSAFDDLVARHVPTHSETPCLTRGGERRTVAWSNTVILDAGGSVTYVLWNGIDVTLSRKLEAELRQAQRIDAVGRLAGGIAHDFSNLLLAILGTAQLLHRTLDPDHPAHADLDMICRTAERAGELTRGLLAFARRQALETVPLDLNSVVAAITPMLRRLIPENIAVDHVPGHQLGTVLADRSQIEQVIMNLCLNARDAMPTGGVLTIETENVVINGAYVATHPWAKEGRYVLLSVSDSGVGMDSNTLDRVFEPFFTTKEQGHGTGLGLAIAYGVVKQHGGIIHAYSEPGRGTTLKVYLPTVERRAIEVGTKIDGPVKGGNESILVVEDESDVRQIMMEILDGLGYDVRAATNGSEALTIIERERNRLDLVITDVVMPAMGGWELFERTRTIAPRLRFLFSSGYPEAALQKDHLHAPGVSFLSKPYGIDTLGRKVREVLDQASESERRP